MESIGSRLNNHAQQIQKHDETIQEIIRKYPKELVEQALERVDKILAQEILARKHCPLIGKKGWDCGQGLRNGEEEWCKNITHINCGAFNRYFLYLLTKSVKEKRSKKER